MKTLRVTRQGLVRGGLAGLSGLIAGYAALAVAELVSAAVRPEAGPINAVGGAAIDRTPAPVKDFAIRHFGEDDKFVLQLGILATLSVLALVLGIVALRFRRVGSAGVLLFGVVGAAAAVSRPDSTGIADGLPSLVGAVVGAVLLYVLIGLLRPSEAADGDVRGEPWNRRRFLVTASSAAVASTGVGALGRVLNDRAGENAVASRADVVLPQPASKAAPIPPGAQLRVPGISSFITPSKTFYRVDTALVVPKIDATTWKLRIHGKGVQRPLSVTFQDLLERELIERDITLTCVSNEVGGPYVGNASWIGARLADLLREAGVKPPSRGGPANQIISRSVDGMTLGTPVEDVMDGRDAMLAVGMNGEPLTFVHGFPVRMVVPGLYGYVSACKWIEDIELTTFDDYDAYWVKRDWAREAPIKTQSRIDVPKPFARLQAGTVMIAGVAWAQHRGIEGVEVRIDEGPWQPAELAAQDTIDTWRQWSYAWKATPGGHSLTVRATDSTGETQTEKRTGTVPNGASGWHSVVLTVD
ncbi:molybdopterin-dependent oxidoreductase [Streptomyces sp. NPDC002057]|uniref:molybdopterin-dependent oxidoreductase n=1 Tax=Streptomyces sp. NPDC002057 TaxID=3154664 RepID=UPI0033274491